MSDNDEKKRVFITKKRTKQDKLSAEEIRDKLEDYLEVEDISTVPLNTHIRYFSIIKSKKGKTKKIFRIGGFLKNKDNAESFVILTNGKNSWSVQTDSAIFFRKMNIDEIKDQYEDEIEELENIILKLKKKNSKLKSLVKKMKEMLNL